MRRCAIIGKRVNNLLSLYSGKCTPSSERMEREWVVMMKIKGMLVSSRRTSLSKEEGIGKMKQHPLHSCSVEICALFVETLGKGGS